MACHHRTVWRLDCPSPSWALCLDCLPSCSGMTEIAGRRTGLCASLEDRGQVWWQGWQLVFQLNGNNILEAETPDSPSVGIWPATVNLTAPHPSYHLQSPLYPVEYPNMMDLEIIFSSPPGSTIVIEFISFHLENETNCSYDRLTIAEQVLVHWVQIFE